MKQQEGKSKKQRQSKNTRTAKTACGTLSYLSECRGAMQKKGGPIRLSPPDGIDRSVRK